MSACLGGARHRTKKPSETTVRCVGQRRDCPLPMLEGEGGTVPPHAKKPPGKQPESFFGVDVELQLTGYD